MMGTRLEMVMQCTNSYIHSLVNIRFLETALSATVSVKFCLKLASKFCVPTNFDLLILFLLFI
jgi:hypothetical protein